MHIFFIWARDKFILSEYIYWGFQMATSQLFFFFLTAHWPPDYTSAHNTPTESWSEQKETGGGGSADEYESNTACTSFCTVKVKHLNAVTLEIYQFISEHWSFNTLPFPPWPAICSKECLHNKKKRKKEKCSQPRLGNKCEVDAKPFTKWRIYLHNTFLFSFKNNTMRSACSHLTPEQKQSICMLFH